MPGQLSPNLAWGHFMVTIVLEHRAYIGLKSYLARLRAEAVTGSRNQRASAFGSSEELTDLDRASND